MSVCRPPHTDSYANFMSGKLPEGALSKGVIQGLCVTSVPVEMTYYVLINDDIGLQTSKMHSRWFPKDLGFSYYMCHGLNVTKSVPVEISIGSVL